MTANEKQIGGDHYKSTYEVWDFSIDALEGRFFETTICKYVARHSKKNGLEDLEKAKHYTEKLLELRKNVRTFGFIAASDLKTAHIERFVAVNELAIYEKEIIRIISTWWGSSELQYVIDCIDRLIQSYKSQ